MLHSCKTVAVPPGETIKEQLETREMRQKEFAERMGLSEKHISRLINGKVELTPDVALRLESVLGLPASFWNNLESLYREQLARVSSELDMEEDERLAEKFPYAKIANLGWVKSTRSKQEKIFELRSFFEVAKLGLLENLAVPGIAYRKNGENEKSDYALAAWAQKARLEARKIATHPINIAKLKDEIGTIRAMTILPPEIFCGDLTELLAGCGVAIVFLPHIGGSFLHGASFVDGNHIVLGLTVRGKNADCFWFSLFHELYHIIEGHINTVEPTTEDQEREADRFAGDTLIPPDKYQRFVGSCGFYSVNGVKDFAERIGIAPGIVVGRLQNDNRIPYSRFNNLKVKYTISD